jgi:hypothetical protein
MGYITKWALTPELRLFKVKTKKYPIPVLTVNFRCRARIFIYKIGRNSAKIQYQYQHSRPPLNSEGGPRVFLETKKGRLPFRSGITVQPLYVGYCSPGSG